MAGKSLTALALVVVFAASCAPRASAGPISIFTQIRQAGSGGDEIPVTGLGSFATLTTGGGVNNVVTVGADQTAARQAVVGFWPVIGFRDQAHYEAERGAVAVVPPLPVSLYAEVWNGEYGRAAEVQRLFVDAIVSAQVGPQPGQNFVNWTFPEPTRVVRFGQTLVSITYEPVRMPTSQPQVYFDDGSPPIGFPGPVYYPTLVEASVTVERPADPAPTDSGTGSSDPGGSPPETPPAVPEPATGMLLAGLTLGGLALRRGRSNQPHEPEA